MQASSLRTLALRVHVQANLAQGQTITACISKGDVDTCKSALENAYGTSLEFECVKEGSDDECLKAVRGGEADVTIVGGGHELYVRQSFE
eukprot:1143662-Pelagomonas_calceolata.AAC.2